MTNAEKLAHFRNEAERLDREMKKVLSRLTELRDVPALFSREDVEAQLSPQLSSPAVALPAYAVRV